MRKLNFLVESEADRSVFRTLYFGFVQGGVALHKDKDKKPRSEVRLEARILEKLDNLCIEDSTQPLPWKLVKDGSVVLTDEEYELVDKHLDHVNWPTGSAREAARLFDYWGQAEKVSEIGKSA